MQTNDQIYYELGLQGYTGTLDDRIYAYLEYQGYTGAMNDRLRSFFFSLGYVGTFTDQYAQWRDAGYPLFSPSLLFLSGEVGTWFDPSDVSLNWRRNLFTYTEQFDNAAWEKQGATISENSEIAPNGTMTMDKLIPSNGSQASRAFIGGVAITTQAYTLTVYAKKGEKRYLQLFLNSVEFTANNFANFDLETGTLGTIGSATTASIDFVENDIYRCRITSTASVAGNPVYVAYLQIVDSSTAARNATCTGDGTSGLYIWGAQFEQSSTATDYQRIVTPEITYVADVQPQPILYQDQAGTIPVTAVEQPVSLMLDKSKGLVIGPELVTNGDFSDGLTGWTDASSGTGLAIISEKVRVIDDGVNYGRLRQAVTTVAGKTYKVSFDVSDSIVSRPRFNIGTAAGLNDVLGNQSFSSGTFICVFRAVGATTWLNFFGNVFSEVTNYTTFDNISVKEIAGNHAYTPAAASTSRPTLSARYNLLTYSEQFDNAAWTKANATISANSAVAPDGTLTADKLIPNATTALCNCNQVISKPLANVTYSVYAKAGENSWLYFYLLPTSNNDFTNDSKAYFNLSTGSLGTVKNATASITSVGNGWYRCVVTTTNILSATSSVNLQYILANVSGDNVQTITGDGTSGIYIWGADLRVSNDGVGIPDYQRVGNGSAGSSDYDTVNFPPYLRFDGTDDYMLTNSIDFTGTDKMTCFAGVRKLSDALRGAVTGLSSAPNANNGTFEFFAPRQDTETGYGFSSRGTNISTSTAPTTYIAPITNVVVNSSDISGDAIITRINGSQVATSATDQGTGNYGNYPIYIGRRGGSSIPFNGRLGQLIIRGAESTASEITNTEQWINSKIKAY